jgi:hypothetical protein
MEISNAGLAAEGLCAESYIHNVKVAFTSGKTAADHGYAVIVG